VKQADFDKKTAIEQLVDVMTMLRDPEFGCPWDIEQTIRSLVPFTLEEVYEVVDAIELGDTIELEEELGDLLFQVVFYSQIAKEDGDFNFDGVAKAITAKLLRRHPHVFPDGSVERFGVKSVLATDEVAANWDKIKRQERVEKAARKSQEQEKKQITQNNVSSRDDDCESVLDAVPAAMPAVMQAMKLQVKASKEGFDWDELKPVLAKLREEIAEFEEAIEQNDAQAINNELGDILFTTVNIARHAKVEPETALRGANQRFSARFKWIEKELRSADLKMNALPASELDQLWERAKKSGLKTRTIFD
jgi:ATP diphosphatase